MIDIHCHIIPVVDDGVQSMEEALSLIRQEVRGGTSAFIATPHFIDKNDYTRLKDVAGLAEQVALEVKSAGIEAAIHPGGEIYPTHSALEAIDRGVPLTLAGKGRHMLVDLPMGSLPQDFDGILFEIQSRKIAPILAHPERCSTFQEQPDLIGKYVERGIAVQVNARSLVGKYGPRAIEVALLILRKRWAHFLASDAHRASREPILGGARASLLDEFGEDYLDLITRRSAEQVLKGQELPELPSAPPETKEKKWLSRIFRK